MKKKTPTLAHIARELVDLILLILFGPSVSDYAQGLLFKLWRSTALPTTTKYEYQEELFMNISRKDYFAIQFAMSNLSETINTRPANFINWIKHVLFRFGFTFLEVKYISVNNKDKILRDAVSAASQLCELLKEEEKYETADSWQNQFQSEEEEKEFVERTINNEPYD